MNGLADLFSGQTVLVTGATGGLGAALVDALVARGDDVIALDRSAAGTGHPRVRAFTVDLLDENAVAGVLADAAGAGATIHHVVALAGGALPEEKVCVDPAELSLAVFTRSLEQNLTTAWITLRAALPYLRVVQVLPIGSHVSIENGKVPPKPSSAGHTARPQ